MLFNSLEYLIFFAVVLVVSWLTCGWMRFRTYFIILASLYFYISNNTWAVLILIGTTTIDYLICLRMDETDDDTARKRLLWLSVVSNLGVLGLFKYFNFLGATAEAVATSLGVRLSWVDVNIALPVGISFYTFEAMSYTIDVYRRKIPASKDYARLAFLVSFFPHLIAGPIVRAADFFPQIDSKPRLSLAQLEAALFLIAAGLFKKIILADSLAPLADATFTDPRDQGTIAVWIGVYAFAFQIYFDFSGYTDIALGSALLLGYRLPENFIRPYAAQSGTDFWRRWHITLSTWLRDYLYVSLGGNRMKTRWGVCRNLMITMFLGGLWHGAAWHFAIWGVAHGLWLSAERLLGFAPRSESSSAIAVALRIFLVFQGTVLLWLIFRAESMELLAATLRGMVTPKPTVVTNGMITAVATMALAWTWQIVNEFMNVRKRLAEAPVLVKATAYSVVCVLVVIFNIEEPRSFIYFRF